MDQALTIAAHPSIRTMLDANPRVGEQRAGPRRFWTTREEGLLKKHYPAGGVPACLPLLAGRSAAAIYGHAGKLGLKSPASAKHDFRRKRWTSSEQIDAAIRQTYLRAPTRNAISELADAVMRPRWWVSKRATRLGLTTPRFKELPWSDEEKLLVHDNYHKDPQTIVRLLKRHGFTRTPTAVKVMGKRLGAMREDPHHYTGNGLATLMGVDAKTVGGWIARGLLLAKRRGTDRVAEQGGDQHWIHRRNVRRFIIENVATVDLRKVDKFWFVDLVAGGAE